MIVDNTRLGTLVPVHMTFIQGQIYMRNRQKLRSFPQEVKLDKIWFAVVTSLSVQAHVFFCMILYSRYRTLHS